MLTKQSILANVVLLAIFCHSFTLKAQDPSPVFKINYHPNVLDTNISHPSIQSFFKELNEEIMGETPIQEGISKDAGQIVLPASSYELLNGRTPVPWVSLSPLKNYLVACKMSKDYSEQTAFLFNYSTGKLIATFDKVTQFKFSEDDRNLAIAYKDEWGIYNTEKQKIIFQKSYEPNYNYESGYDSEDFIFINNDLFVFVEEHEKRGKNKINLFSLENGKMESVRTLKDNYYIRSNIQTKNNLIAYTEVYSREFKYSTDEIRRIIWEGKSSTLYDYAVVFINPKTLKEEVRLKDYMFIAFAEKSNTALIKLVKTQKLYQYSLKDKKMHTPIEVGYTEDITFCHNDSLILVNPTYSTSEIKFYSSKTGRLVKTIEGRKASCHPNNTQFFIVKKRYYGDEIPSLYSFDTYEEILSMKGKKNNLKFSDNGRYLIMEEDKGNSYSFNRCSIIDLQTSQRKLSFEDRIQIGTLDDDNLIAVSISDRQVIEFYDIEHKKHLMFLYVNRDGWLCFDQENRYDCSDQFKDHITFACFESTSFSNWQPIPFFRKDLHVSGLWSKCLTGYEYPFSTVGLKRCLGQKNDYYTLAKIEQHEMSSVNFVIDPTKDIVDLKNYSGKPITICKSEILYQVNVWDEKGAKMLFYFFVDNFGGFLALTPDGYFTQSSNFHGKVAIAIDNELYEVDQLFETYYRPDIIEGLLVNETINNRTNNNIKRGISSPPKIKLQTNKLDNTRGASIEATTFTKSIEVQVTAFNSGGGIRGIRLFNNNKIVDEIVYSDLHTSDSLVFNTQVNLQPGENTMTAVGWSRDHTESKPVQITYSLPSSTENTVKPNLYILSVGIDSYKNANYNLNYCVNDMQTFTDSVKAISQSIFNNTFSWTLNDEQATKSNILNMLDSISQLCKPQDVFIFYYAGHGYAPQGKEKSEFFFIANEVTQMSDSKNCTTYGLSGSEIRGRFKNIQANKQIAFIDACNSGTFTQQFTVRGASMENSLAKLSRSTGSAIYASTTTNQYASELKQLGHGVFTYVLLNALNGNAAMDNCEITATTLKSYIDNEVPNITKLYNGLEQYPTTFIYGQDFPLGIRCKQQ